MKRRTDQSFRDKFNTDVAEGSLFYPCCGNDLQEPIGLFKDSIDEFHFVDQFPIHLLPEEQPIRYSGRRFFTLGK